VIVDECHHVPAVTFESLLKACPIRRIVGLTATPVRKDGLEKASLSAMRSHPPHYPFSTRPRAPQNRLARTRRRARPVRRAWAISSTGHFLLGAHIHMKSPTDPSHPDGRLGWSRLHRPIPKWQLRRSSPHGGHEPVWCHSTGKNESGRCRYVATGAEVIGGKPDSRMSPPFECASTATESFAVREGRNSSRRVTSPRSSRLDRRAGQIQRTLVTFSAKRCLSLPSDAERSHRSDLPQISCSNFHGEVVIDFRNGPLVGARLQVIARRHCCSPSFRCPPANGRAIRLPKPPLGIVSWFGRGGHKPRLIVRAHRGGFRQQDCP